MPEKDIWTKYLAYLRDLAPRIYVSKSVRVLTQEALRVAPEDARLRAINEFIEIVARPEPASKSTKFEF